MKHQTNMYKSIIMTSVVVFCLFGPVSTGFSEEAQDQAMMKASGEQRTTDGLPPNQRIIFGTVEGVNENTIKVNAGAAGNMSPRYLELEKLEKKLT